MRNKFKDSKMVKQLETRAVSFISSSSALYWWRIVKTFGRVRESDLYGTNKDILLGDIALLRMSGLVTFEREDGVMYVVDDINPIQVDRFLNLMEIVPTEFFPTMFTDTERKVLDLVEGYVVVHGDKIGETVGRGWLAAVSSLREKGLLVKNDEFYSIRFMGNENNCEYNLTRVESLNIQEGETRWALR